MRMMRIRSVLLMMVVVVKCCLARSEGEGERHRSHQSTDPGESVDKFKKYESNQNSIVDKELESKDVDSNYDVNERVRVGGDETDSDQRAEEGEVKDGDDYVFPVAKTKLGMLLGRVEESRGGQRILAFRGIRHVQPPIGDLRFKAPVATTWLPGIVEAKTNGQPCPQHLANKPDIWVGSEDCLWLNVFTRDLVAKRGRPVIVWIHGGSFSRGSAAEYDPDYFLDQDVVLVTIQYRLGMFGFLSTETSAAPGNYGMLDQVAALRWVKQNIETFSGDPDMVTIMGQQAGGASVHYHILSPITRGLFNRAVSLSGTALCWWASIKRSQEKAKKVAKMIGCPQEVLGDMEKLIDCVKGTSMMDLMNTLPNFYQWKHLEQTQEPMTAWSPRVDPEAAVDNGHLSFMPQEPIDILSSGNFQHSSWITGVTDDEGATRASALFSDEAVVKEFEKRFERFGPLMFGFHDGQSEAPLVMADKVKDHYFGDKITKSSLVDAISDSSYAHPVTTAAKLHAKNGAKVFLYHFGYRGKNSLSHIKPNEYPPTLITSSHHYGVGNGDDLIYLFPVHSGLFRPLPSDDIKFSNQFIELLTSFVKTGNPSVELNVGETPLDWTAVNTTGGSQLVSQLNIGNVIRMDKGLPNHRRMSFWQSLPVYWNTDNKYYKPAPPLVRRDEL